VCVLLRAVAVYGVCLCESKCVMCVCNLCVYYVTLCVCVSLCMWCGLCVCVVRVCFSDFGVCGRFCLRYIVSVWFVWEHMYILCVSFVL